MKSSLRITVSSSCLLVKPPIRYVQWQSQPHSKSRSRLAWALVPSVNHDAFCWLRVSIKFSTWPWSPLRLLFSYIGEQARIPPLSSFPHVQGHQGIGTEIKITSVVKLSNQCVKNLITSTMGIIFHLKTYEMVEDAKNGRADRKLITSKKPVMCFLCMPLTSLSHRYLIDKTDSMTCWQSNYKNI